MADISEQWSLRGEILAVFLLFFPLKRCFLNGPPPLFLYFRLNFFWPVWGKNLFLLKPPPLPQKKRKSQKSLRVFGWKMSTSWNSQVPMTWPWTTQRGRGGGWRSRGGGVGIRPKVRFRAEPLCLTVYILRPTAGGLWWQTTVNSPHVTPTLTQLGSCSTEKIFWRKILNKTQILNWFVVILSVFHFFWKLKTASGGGNGADR